MKKYSFTVTLDDEKNLALVVRTMDSMRLNCWDSLI